MAELLNFNPVHALDLNANFVEDAEAYFYRNGTSTLETVYTTSALTTPHPSPLPVVNGRFPAVYSTGTYDVTVDVKDGEGASLHGYPMTAFRAFAGGAAAESISATPFAGVPGENVQTQLQQVYGAISGGAAAFGVGITGNAPTVANLDATNVATSWGRYTDAATGTVPAFFAATNGLTFMWRQTADQGVMLLASPVDEKLAIRYLESGAWGSPIELQTSANVATAVSDSLWQPVANGAVSNGLIVSGLEDYRDILITAIGVTASDGSSNRIIRVGDSGGILTTSIYHQNSAVATGFLTATGDSGTGVRAFSMEIIGFNTTWAFKPVMGGNTSSASNMPRGIESALAFDRIQFLSSAGTLTGGTYQVFGKK